MRASRLLFLACITLFLVPGSARGQYIYLDSNGDGVHDASDRVQSSGTTTVDVWLRTDANRDGTAATCASEDGPLSMLSYEFILRASNGTIVWGTPQNQVPGLPTEFGLAQSSTEFHVGFYGPSPLPPGLYRLTTLALSVLDGTPSLQFASGASSLAGALQTAFGSSCSGLDFDNSMAFGTEWSDADGLEYGGTVRHAPTLDPIPDQTVNEGENVERNITASDADGDPLTFAKTEGPAFMTVATLTPGTGAASGSIRFTPGFADAGLDTGGVSVSDGFATAQARFRIDVRNVNLAPVIRPVPELQVAAGSSMNYVASGYDPDGSGLHFFKVSGPAFFNIDDLFPGTGVGAGLIWLTPSLSDAGAATAVIGLTDGMSVTEMTVAIRVTVAPVLEAVPDLSVQVGGFLTRDLHAVSGDGDPVTFEKVRGPHFMSVTTVDPGSGYASGRLTLTPVAFDAGTYDVAVRAFDGTDEDMATFRVKIVDPNGSAPHTLFENAFLSYPLPNGPTNGVILDCNGDGKLDLVTLKYEMWPEPLTVSLGHGDGTFEFKQRIPSDDLPTAVVAADFDHDGIQDLAACSNYGPVSIYRGQGDGTFEQVAALPGGSNGYEIRAGDWDGDGSTDLAVVSHGEGLSIYHNRGGAFDEPVHYATGRFPRDMAVGDIDEDGDSDILVPSHESDMVIVFVNQGGSFTRTADLAVPADAAAVLLGDVTGDGHLDLIVRNPTWLLAGIGDGTFGTPVPLDGIGIAALDDLDGDGKLDAVGPVGAGGLDVWMGLGGGRFDAPRFARTGQHIRAILPADLNSDGKPDLVALDEYGNQACIHLNLGGRFSTPTTTAVPPNVTGMASGDWNRDGLQDAALISSDPPALFIRYGDPDTGLRTGPECATGLAPSSVVAADLDGDGRLDLLVSDRKDPNLRWYRGDDAGGFGTAVPIPARATEELAVGDFDGDGRNDLALSLSQWSGSGGILVLLGQGDGTFLPPVAYLSMKLVVLPTVGDFDGDGHQDIACFDGALWSRGYLGTLWGQGDGAFVEGDWMEVLAPPKKALALDPDHDGVPSLCAVDPDSNAVVVYGTHGSRTWNPGDRYDTGIYPGAIAAADLNGDGRLDLAVANGQGNSISCFLGNEDASFGSRLDFGSGVGYATLLAGDVTRDQRPDLIALGPDGVSVLLRNRGTTASGHPPVAEAGGPYSATAGVPVQLDGSASLDPDGDPLRFDWTFGDGSAGTGASPLHTYVSGGAYMARLAVDDGRLQGRDSAAVSVAAYLAARAFRKTPSVLVVGAGPPRILLAIEPQGEAFAVDQIDQHSLWMVWSGGAVPDSIAAESGKGLATSDWDQNGIVEVQVPFAREDLARLFESISGRETVPVALSGTLLTGARFRAALSLSLVSSPTGITASVLPNPLNPRAVLSFFLRRSGVARIDLYDVGGRRVRVLLPPQRLGAGTHDLELDGMDGRGRRLASGVYYYRISCEGLAETGRFAIVR